MLRQRPLHFVSSRLSCRYYSSELPAPRLDLRSISENTKQKAHNAHIRKAPVAPEDVQKITDAYASWRTLQTQLNELRNQRSTLGDRLRNAPPAEKAEMLQAASTLKQQVKELTALVDSAEEQCMGLALLLPNDTHPDVPIGPEPSAKTISTHGPPPISADPRRDHVGICTQFDWADLAAGATSTGSSFYFLKNQGALLELALTNYALSKAIARGYTPMLTPDVVKADIATRCGFQPRDDERQGPSHMYTVQTHPSSPSLVLSGTAEIPIGGSLANKVLSSLSLPLRIVGYGHAFRQEAGARSADTRGLYRVHQFSKVELFAVTSEDESEGMMQELLELQKDILEGLGLSFRYLSFPSPTLGSSSYMGLRAFLVGSFRILDMPSEELGASAYRKYDIEAWMPGRGSWGEVTSLSNCTDFQARRLHIRYKPQGDKTSAVNALGKLPFAHTLNGTAAAIPRLIVALLENGAILDEAGKVTQVTLPSALRKFWIGDAESAQIAWSD